jgi:hypothetical protein
MVLLRMKGAHFFKAFKDQRFRGAFDVLPTVTGETVHCEPESLRQPYHLFYTAGPETTSGVL